LITINIANKRRCLFQETAMKIKWNATNVTVTTLPNHINYSIDYQHKLFKNKSSMCSKNKVY